MVLKCNQRGHSTLHPSMPQYVLMWCWRSSLQNPDPKRFLEELETLLWTKNGRKIVKTNLAGGFEENPNMEASRLRNDCFHFSAWNQGVHGLHTKIARILIGTSTPNMTNNIPWLKNTWPSKGRALSYSTTPWITPGKDTKSGTGANVPTCCWRGRGLGRDFLLPVLKVCLLSYPATKSCHTANSWTHTANPFMNPYQALIPCTTGCRRATMASLPGPDLGTEACGSTGTEASASSAGATGSGTTSEASGTSCLGIWGVHWPKLMKNDGNDVQ